MVPSPLSRPVAVVCQCAGMTELLYDTGMGMVTTVGNDARALAAEWVCSSYRRQA
jgi:hypothetical protein